MVKAVNAMGSGPASNVVSVSTPGPFVPDAPRNVAAANGSMKVTISWQAPDSDGGTPILGYKIWYFWNGTYFPLAAVGENVRSWTFTSTVSGDTREFFVSAFNEVGDGPNSAGVYGETLAASTDNTMLYLGGGLVLIAVVGVGLYLLMRRKK
jgi:titin